ncbi:MAG: hypothetical protein M0T85_01035 [Dehalococcoidales bacterium]|nr:hypothetical protein [Dehalococcoidales bacterium]
MDEGISEIESATDALVRKIMSLVGAFEFRRLGARQFQDLGQVYESRGGPAAALWIQSQMRDSKRDEWTEYQKLRTILDAVIRSPLDHHLKGFILRKLPLLIKEDERGDHSQEVRDRGDRIFSAQGRRPQGPYPRR